MLIFLDNYLLLWCCIVKASIWLLKLVNQKICNSFRFSCVMQPPDGANSKYASTVGGQSMFTFLIQQQFFFCWDITVKVLFLPGWGRGTRHLLWPNYADGTKCRYSWKGYASGARSFWSRFVCIVFKYLAFMFQILLILVLIIHVSSSK